MPSADKIPTNLIGLLSNVFPDRYTHAQIDSLFQYCGAPDLVFDGSKAAKVQAWLRKINTEAANPLLVFGKILDDFFNAEVNSNTIWDSSSQSDHAIKLEEQKNKVRVLLSQNGLQFIEGGTIIKIGSPATISLGSSASRLNLSTINLEIDRALAQIENDPHAAVHYAGNVLESTLKEYLLKKSVDFKESDSMQELWKLSTAEMGLNAAELDNKDLKKIVSGLHSIVDGMAHLRNNKSAAHGKSASQMSRINIKSRHARLAIHAAHTVSTYIVELIGEG